MQGRMEALVSGILMRGLSPALSVVLMAAPSRKAIRAQLKKIYVLNDHGEMTGEYTLDADCPIDYDDFLKVLPPEGIGDRDSLFVGEYVFTAFQSGKLVFVLLSRGHLASEDVDWTALLLVREQVMKALEEERSSKRIGKSLEAQVTITAADPLFPVLAQYKDQLRYLFIVSAVTLNQGSGNGSGGVHIEVKKADGLKCDRCWNYSTHVGEDKAYPTVCERCSAVLKELEQQ